MDTLISREAVVVDSSADDEPAAPTYTLHWVIFTFVPRKSLSGDWSFIDVRNFSEKIYTTRHIYLAAIYYSTINPPALRLRGDLEWGIILGKDLVFAKLPNKIPTVRKTCSQLPL